MIPPPPPPNSPGSGSGQEDVEQLKVANLYLRTALDQVNEGVIMLDAGPLDGSGPRVLYSNLPVACIMGVEPVKGLRGLHLADLVTGERDTVVLLNALRDAAEQGSAECQAQIQTFYSRGSHYCNWRVKAVQNQHKRVLNYTLTIQLVPNELTLQTGPLSPLGRPEEVDAQSERLRIENLAAMARGIAHDVNNLLGPITAQLSYVLPQIDHNSELGQTLDMVLAAVKRAKQFTSQVVKAAKSRSAPMQDTNIAEIINDTVRLAQAGSNVQVRVKLAPDLQPAWADGVKISQVLQNLVLNGIQAMPNGGYMDVEARNVDVRLGQEGSLTPGRYVEVVVRDRGTGISQDNLSRLFRESFTTKEDGNGIGLTTCHRFIEEHKGAIRVSSTLNIGTEFRLLLPASEAPAVPVAPQEPVTQAPKVIKQMIRGTGAVMIVDDEPHIRGIAGFILQKCGYDVYETDNGEDAVRNYQSLARAGSPLDAVLMDLTLKGGMTGMETARAIWDFDPKAKIIISSGSVTEDVQASFVGQGFFAILPKPYEAADLSEVIACACGAAVPA